MNPFLGLSFGAPLAALLLLPLGLWLWWRARRPRPAVLFPRVDLLTSGPIRGRWTPRALVALRTLAILTGIIALAAPRAGAFTRTVRGDGISILLVVDLSSSMLAEDFRPNNRLEVAKVRLREFVNGRKDDEIGLVAFSGEALTQVPLTLDYPIVTTAIEQLQSGQLEDGTAIGTAIATATNRLRDAAGRSRVMILLTDGENNRGTIDPRTAADAAAAMGVRIYTIGVGSEGMAPVPVGRGVFGLRFENRPVRIDEPLMQDVARVTGGRYFRARDGQALQRIYEQIDQLERAPVRAVRRERFRPLHQLPLALLVGCLTCELALLAWRGPLP
ncbi:MAG: VWA domain-containing protein [Gemmatimonadaceae bacterium]|nr:VWA domain-containing protein [Gemmatimonadaceae bacterium]